MARAFGNLKAISSSIIYYREKLDLPLSQCVRRALVNRIRGFDRNDNIVLLCVCARACVYYDNNSCCYKILVCVVYLLITLTMSN